MGIATKDIGQIASKWSQRANAATPDYTAGVKNPRKDWAQNTAQAAPAWEQGVAEAVGNKRFERGVSKAGTAKWQAAAISKGSVRYGPGVSQAQPAFAAGFGPVLQIIQGVNLPPRAPAGSPSNAQRITILNDALHRAKVGL